METLDDIETLVRLLERERNKDPVSEECRKRVQHYIINNQSVSHLDILSIKWLTKIGTQILRNLGLDSPGLEKISEKLYHFNLEGVQKIGTEHLEEVLEETGVIFKSHLHSHAAYAAEVRFELAKKRGESLDVQAEWLERCYNVRIISANIIQDTDPMHAAYSYSFAGDAAEGRFKLAKRRCEGLDVLITWARRWYDAEKNSADKSVSRNQKHTAYARGFEGKAAFALFEVTRDISWLRKSYEACKSSAELHIKKKNLKLAAYANNSAGNAAKILFEKTGEKEWAREAARCFDQSLNYFKFHPDPRSVGLESEISFKRQELAIYL